MDTSIKPLASPVVTVNIEVNLPVALVVHSHAEQLTTVRVTPNLGNSPKIAPKKTPNLEAVFGKFP